MRQWARNHVSLRVFDNFKDNAIQSKRPETVQKFEFRSTAFLKKIPFSTVFCEVYADVEARRIARQGRIEV